MWIPAIDNVLSVHEQLVQLFVDDEDPISPPGVKSGDLLESACQRPHTSLGGVEKYPDIFQKLAALFHSLTKNHGFHNGNKRTALVTLLTALYRNDRRLCDSITDDTLFDFVVAVTADSYPAEGHPLTADRVVEEIAAWIKSSSEKIAGRGGSMKVADFVKRCADAGANVKHVKGGAISISNGRRGSIRISRSAPRDIWSGRKDLSPSARNVAFEVGI